MPQRVTSPACFSTRQLAALVASHVACAGPRRFQPWLVGPASPPRLQVWSMVSRPQWWAGVTGPFDGWPAHAIIAVLLRRLQSGSHRGSGQGSPFSMQEGEGETPPRARGTVASVSNSRGSSDIIGSFRSQSVKCQQYACTTCPR